jgi:hypothetical protein
VSAGIADGDDGPAVAGMRTSAGGPSPPRDHHPYKGKERAANVAAARGEKVGSFGGARVSMCLELTDIVFIGFSRGRGNR